MANSKMKQKEIRKGDKLTVGRLFANVAFILRYAISIDRFLVFAIMASLIICGVIYALFDTLFLKLFIDIISDKNKDLTQTLIFVIGGMIVMALNQLLEIVTENWARAKFIKTSGMIQKDFIKKASEIDLICYDNKEYFDDFVIAASQSEEMITTGILSTAWIIGNVTTIVTLGALIMTINPVIALFPIAGFIINMVTRFKITKLEYDYEMERKRIMRKADYSKRVFYQPEYAKEIKLSNIEVPLQKQFEEAVDEVQTTARAVGVKIAIYSLINWICVFTLLSYFCVPMYLGYLALVVMKISLGDVAAMNSAQSAVRNRLDELNYAIVEFQKVGQFAERFRRFIEYEIHIEKNQGGKKTPPAKAVLEIKNMSFRYDGAEHDTLHDINLVVKPGEKIALVGENGAGKTTFVKLLMRLYDVTQGGIFYDGTDIREYGTSDYRKLFGAVFQDYQIYGASLAENVTMEPIHWDENHTMSPQQVKQIEEALTLADFTKKLAKLPKGLETEMTREFCDDGTMLSGGEAQKVAIARMFAKSNDFSIAVLDEPSSALDPLAEHLLNENMIRGAKDAAIIFISHRLSTTKDADRIYMFENGRIIEEGTHEEL
ncbi:MAG: ABC transporter ATP-binding protein, partial [Clostridiales bacterium]|nr:ABC transporter ATP-binding protein [Clostridiales bacterium]